MPENWYNPQGQNPFMPEGRQEIPSRQIPQWGGLIDPGQPFAGNMPGEARLTSGAQAPLLSLISNVLQPQLQTALQRPQTIAGAFGGLGGVEESLLDLMLATPEQQAASLSRYQQLQAPGRQQATQQAQSRLASMGLGGMRAGRALGQQERGFASADELFAQQLAEQAVASRMRVGDILSEMAGQEAAAGTTALNDILNMLTTTAGQLSQVPLQAWQAFKPTA